MHNAKKNQKSNKLFTTVEKQSFILRPVSIKRTQDETLPNVTIATIYIYIYICQSIYIYIYKYIYIMCISITYYIYI